MKTIVPGMLVELLPCPNEYCDAHKGEFHVVRQLSPVPDCWFVEPPVFHPILNPLFGQNELAWHPMHLRPITPPPGVVSEQEVKELFQPSPKKETVE